MAQMRGAHRAASCRLMLMGIALSDPRKGIGLRAEQDIYVPNPLDIEGVLGTLPVEGIEDSSDSEDALSSLSTEEVAAELSGGEPTGPNTDFPRLPVGVISDIASIPLFTGIHYSDVFKRISEIPDLPDADIAKLKEILSNLEDQQFFDFCMQQSHFPGSLAELKSFCEKLGVYISRVFGGYRDKLLEFEKYRDGVARSHEHLASVNEPLRQIDPELYYLREIKRLKTIRYFKRTVIRDSIVDAEGALRQKITWKIDYEILERLFRFISILCQLSVRWDAPSKECWIASAGTVIVNWTEDVMDALERRACFMESVRYFRVSNLSGDIELDFPRPEKIAWVEISGKTLDLRGRNMDWILEHRGIHMLALRSEELLLDTGLFGRLNRLKGLRDIAIVLEDRGCNSRCAEGDVPAASADAAALGSEPQPVELCGMEELRSFSAINFAPESLRLRRMPELHTLFLSRCSLKSVSLLDMPRMFSVSLNMCRLDTLTLQSIRALGHLALLNSSFDSITLSNVSEVEMLDAIGLSFKTLHIQHDFLGSSSLAKVGRMYFEKCSLGRMDLGGVGSVERLTMFRCDLSGGSVWGSLAALRSLKYLLVNECTGLQRLPHEIGGIKGLEGLYLDLRALDSAGVGKCAEGSGDVDLSESFRFPETLKECYIFCEESLVSTICGRWFEKCRQELKLVVNGNSYIVTDDCRVKQM